MSSSPLTTQPPRGHHARRPVPLASGISFHLSHLAQVAHPAAPLETFKFSTDPELEAKIPTSWPYLPSHNAVVVSVTKSQIQALTTAPMLRRSGWWKAAHANNNPTPPLTPTKTPDPHPPPHQES